MHSRTALQVVRDPTSTSDEIESVLWWIEFCRLQFRDMGAWRRIRLKELERLARKALAAVLDRDCNGL